MARIHVVMNRKGGVNKSLISLNMGAVYADVRGTRPDRRPHVVVASADPQGTTKLRWQTTDWVLKPTGVVFEVVIYKWSPAEGQAYVDGTGGWCEDHRYPVAQTLLRRYRVHTNATEVVTEYPNRVEFRAAEDFYRLGLEHGLRGAAERLGQLTSSTAALAATAVTS